MADKNNHFFLTFKDGYHLHYDYLLNNFSTTSSYNLYSSNMETLHWKINQKSAIRSCGGDCFLSAVLLQQAP